MSANWECFVSCRLPVRFWCWAPLPRFCKHDILRHIHSLLPMRDVARAACVSHAFLCSWRCHPNLTFSSAASGMNKKASENDEIARDFSKKVDRILRNHSGIGVKKLKIHMIEYCNDKALVNHINRSFTCIPKLSSPKRSNLQPCREGIVS